MWKPVFNSPGRCPKGPHQSGTCPVEGDRDPAATAFEDHRSKGECKDCSLLRCWSTRGAVFFGNALASDSGFARHGRQFLPVQYVPWKGLDVSWLATIRSSLIVVILWPLCGHAASARQPFQARAASTTFLGRTPLQPRILRLDKVEERINLKHENAQLFRIRFYGDKFRQSVHRFRHWCSECHKPPLIAARRPYPLMFSIF
jgi:hypothetical protein